MRIGIDGTPLHNFQSGVGIYVRQLLQHLVQVRPEWDYLLYSNKPFVENGLPATTPAAGYFPRSRWLWMQLKLPRLIPQTGVDLCHFMNNSAPAGCPTPYVITIHDASLFLYSQYHPWSRLLALRLLLPQAARRAQAIITVSHSSRRELITTMRLPPEKVHVVYNAVSQEFQPLRDTEQQAHLRQKYGLPPRFVLYVGAIEPRKNLPRLIAAFARIQAYHPDSHLVLAGPGGWMMDGVLDRAIARAELTGRVHYLGFVPQEDLPGIYSLATLFAFPSLHEGFGLPLLEAMACGTPVLTSNRSAMPEICGPAAFLVDPSSVSSIAEGLNELLDSPAQREWYVAQGLARVQQFSWAEAAQETAALYEHLLAGSDSTHQPPETYHLNGHGLNGRRPGLPKPPATGAESPLTATLLETAVYRTVAYADLFDYPLTLEEIRHYLEGVPATPAEIENSLAGSAFLRQRLSYRRPYYLLAGREEICQIRQQRHATSQALWPGAVKYGRLMASLPFTRMVAVTGSLAVNNVKEDADIDYLIVTRRGRVWLGRAFVILVVRLAARAGYLLCPNYILAESALAFSDQNLYTAHELAQMAPLYGLGIYQQMRQANPWTRRFLPNAGGLGHSRPNLPPAYPAVQKLLELPLQTPAGRWLDNWEMARKIEKFSRLSGLEADFHKDWCKGHFESHKRRVLTAYQHKFAESASKKGAP